MEYSLGSLQAFLARNLPAARHLHVVNVAYALCALYVARKVLQITHRRLRTTALRGPPSPSFLFGVTKTLVSSPDSGEVYEKWAEEYGGVYEISSVLGMRKVVLCDPKAIAHVWGAEPWSYTVTPVAKVATEHLMGKNSIFTSVGEDHRRKRRALNPAFSNASIRNLSPIFYDSTYKAKAAWESLIGSHGGSAVIEVQSWMNHLSLDTIGIAGFSHDFGSLDGKETKVTEVFEDINGVNESSSIIALAFEFNEKFPLLFNLIAPFWKYQGKLNDALGVVANELLTKLSKEKEAGTLGESEEKSVLGLLVKAEAQDSRLRLTREEVMAQARILILAGYESTSVTMTWALIELARAPDVQTRLRTELLEFGADPTYDQLPNNLPYLDAVVHEILRVHAPVVNFIRMATVDDVIPLSKPVVTRSGQLVDHISVAKGTLLFISASAVNRSRALWGPDAKEFRPERWITDAGIPNAAKEIQGHRHLLTFIDGPRICVGKGFAIAEFKIVLAILVKNFVFELRDGPDTVIETVMGVLPRPKVAGEQGMAVPLRVRRFE